MKAIQMISVCTEKLKDLKLCYNCNQNKNTLHFVLTSLIEKQQMQKNNSNILRKIFLLLIANCLLPTLFLPRLRL